MNILISLAITLILGLTSNPGLQENRLPTLTASAFTEAVSSDADDPAIWVHPTDPSKSLIFGTDKIKEKGGIYAFNLDGKIVQRIENLDRPNNCDVEYKLGSMDVLVATERLQHRLKIFSIDRRSGRLTDVSGATAVFEKDSGKAREVMGIALYRNPKSGKVFAFVSRSEGPITGYLAQYELKLNPATKKVDAKYIRNFGNFSGKKEIESVFVDDELGFVYYSDETFGTRKYAISNLDKELVGPNTKAFKGDQEGIALYATGKGTGYIVCTDQNPGSSIYHLFDRVTNKPVGSFQAGLDETDGIEITSKGLGSKFPKGIFVGMNSGPKNFGVVDCRRMLGALKLSN